MGILDSITSQVKGGFGITNANSKLKNPNLHGGSSTDPSLKHRNYAVIIKQDQEGQKPPFRLVVGSVPESFQISQDISWSAPFGGGLVGNGTIADLLAVTGHRLVAHVATMQVWQGSSGDVTFTTEFKLTAWSDPYLDVIQPLQTLLRMSMPSLGKSGFLEAPGPRLTKAGIEHIGKTTVKSAISAGSTLLDAGKALLTAGADAGSTIDKTISNLENSVGELTNKAVIEKNQVNKISISIGTWFSLNNIVITNVQHDLGAQLPEANTGLITSVNVTVQFRPVFALTADDIESLLKGKPRQVGNPLGGVTKTVSSSVGKAADYIKGIF